MTHEREDIRGNEEADLQSRKGSTFLYISNILEKNTPPSVEREIFKMTKCEK